MKNRTRIINVALLVVGMILLMALLNGLRRRTAEAQMVFQAGPVIIAAAPYQGGVPERPLYLLDTTTQCLMVYGYDALRMYLRLIAVRKVNDDLQLTEMANVAPSVDQIKNNLEKYQGK